MAEKKHPDKNHGKKPKQRMKPYIVLQYLLKETDEYLIMNNTKKIRSLTRTDFLVRMSGLEPPTPCMSSKYSDQLSYTLKCVDIITQYNLFVNRLN